YPHGHRRRRFLALLHHVEMRVKGRDLIDLGERELHLVRERSKMRGREMAVAILDEMEVLDQEIASALAVSEQRSDLVERARIDLAAFRRLGRSPPARAVCPRVRRR